MLGRRCGAMTGVFRSRGGAHGGTRTGQVVEVTPGSGGDHYRVRWDDGRETVYFPSGDAHLARGN
jgi:hypothetical protein